VLVLFVCLQLSSAVVAQLYSFIGNATNAYWCPSASTCSAVLRLTNSSLNSSGAAWTNFPIDIRSGFNVSFQFRISGKSPSCPTLGGTYAYCMTRGGHGFAFVMQSFSAPPLLGEPAEGLGYAGISNTVAVEFDTWYDETLYDGYDNHISVQCVGPGLPNSNNHRYSLGMTSDIPEMADEVPHLVQLVYSPVLSVSSFQPTLCALSGECEKVQSTSQFSSLLDQGYFNQGVGSLSVFLDDLTAPRFIAPLNLLTLLDTSATSTFGITATTGGSQWQTHDFWNWTVCSNTQCFHIS